MPRIETRPSVGFNCPLAIRSSVDLPGPVGADEPGDAAGEFERHLVEGEDRAVPLRDVLEEEERLPRH